MMGFGLLGIIVIVGGVILIMRYIPGNINKSGTINRHGNNYESALDILKKRFANGEISKEEFDEKKNVVQS